MRGQGGEARPVASSGDFRPPVAGTILRPGLFFCPQRGSVNSAFEVAFEFVAAACFCFIEAGVVDSLLNL